MRAAVRSCVAILALVVVLPAPLALAQVVVVPGPMAPGPFGGTPDTAPAVRPGPSLEPSMPSSDASAPDDSSASAAADAGPASNAIVPSVETAPAVGLLEATSPLSADGAPVAASSAPELNLGGGPLPVPIPVPGPGLGVTPAPPAAIPDAPGAVNGPTSPAPRSRAVASVAPTGANTTTAASSGWLRRLLPAADFWRWLLELLPLILQALLAGLAALLSAWALPPGGVVWRLPPELTHQLSAIGPAHAAAVLLADAALALIVALVGFGHILGPRAGLPVLAPREVAPRIAVAVLVAHGSLAIGGGAIDLDNALLGGLTPATLAGWDPSAATATQGGFAGVLFKLLFSVLGLLLALGGWLRVGLVDVLLVAAPVLAVLWVLPLTAHWGGWALALFGNLLAGQWLQVLALWLGAELLAAPSADLQAGVAKDFAALAVLLVALRLPGLLPGPRGVSALGSLVGAAVVGRTAQSVWRAGQDRFLDDYLRRKALDLDFEEVAARVPDDPRPAVARTVSSGRSPRSDSGSSA